MAVLAQTTATAGHTVLPWAGQPITGPEAPWLVDTPVLRPSPRATPTSGGYTIDPSSRETVRLLYKTVFASSNGLAANWNGDVSGCTAGTTGAAYQDATLRRINWFRAMAGVPAGITLDDTYNQKAQQAALMMSANRQLSHTPPANWLCYTAAGSEGAGKSNIGLGQSGAQAVAEGYMRDPGANNAAAGHRRWMLYPQTQVMGVGNVVPADGTSLEASAIWVQDGRYGSARPVVRDDFVAWPPKGFVPYGTVYPRWSFSYPNADFSAATVTMTENGASIATRRETLANGYGENTLVWFPGSYTDGMNWTQPSTDTGYVVTLSNVKLNGVNRTFSYNVTVFDPEVAGTDTPNLTPRGNSTVGIGQAGVYTFGSAPGNASYQWRALPLSAFTLADGAESGGGNFTFNTSTGYSAVTSDLAASGSHAFHLAHAQSTDQTMLLNTTIVPSASSVLAFSSRLGLASPQQIAQVEVSADGGLTWAPVFSQAGTQNGNTSNFGENSFNRKSISLAAFANATLRLRFRYGYLGGSYYPQSSSGTGWYIDDIGLTGVEAVTENGAVSDVTTPSFNYTATQSGTTLLQARSGLYGYFSEWSAGLRVTANGTGTAVSATDCLLNWAERTVPTLLTPPSTSLTASPYTYRFYSGTLSYLGVSSVDSHVYYASNGQVVDLGQQSTWLAQAGCQ